MAVAENNKRVVVTVSRDVAKEIERVSKELGITQSKLCSKLIGKNIKKNVVP